MRVSSSIKMICFLGYLLIFFSAGQAQNWPPPMPGNEHWSGVFGSSSGPIPFGAKVSAMFPNGDVVIAGDVGTGVKVSKWVQALQQWVDLGDRLRLEGQPFSSAADIEVMANGDVYIIGSFNRADNGTGQPAVECSNIFRWNANANPPAWEPVGEGLSNYPNKLAIDETNGYVYVTGSQTAWNPDGTLVGINRLGRWDIANSQWEIVGVGVNTLISDIALDANNELYICGAFTDILNPDFTNVTVNRAAHWDGNSWHALGQGISSANLNPRDIVIDNSGNVYVVILDAIATNTDNSQVLGPIVYWDGTNWQPTAALPVEYTLEMTTGFNGDVYVLYVDHGFSGPYVAKFDGSTWQGIGQYLGEYTFTIASNKQYNAVRLYWGGLYWQLTNPATGITNAAINNGYFNGNFWIPMAGYGSTNGRILTMHMLGPFGNTMIVGGEFSKIAGIDAQNVALYEGRFWSSMGLGVNGRVNSVHGYYNYVVVGGEFSHAINAPGDSVRANNIAYFNLNTQRWEAVGQGVDGPVYAIWSKLDRLSIGLFGEILVGGKFTTGFNPDGTPVPLNAFGSFRFNPTTDDFWENPGQTNGVTGGAAEVHAIARAGAYDYDLYIGGSFDEGRNANGTTVNSPNILYWDGVTANGWTPLGQGTDGIVRDIEYFLENTSVRNNAIWIGGEFENMFAANGSPIFCRNLGTWYEIVDEWYPVAGGTDGPVYNIASIDAYYQDALAVIAGDFSLGYYPNGNARAINNVALFSIGNPRPGLIPNWNTMGDGANDPVYTATTFRPCWGAGEHVLIGGDFTAVGNKGARDLSKWKRVWRSAVIAHVASSRSSGGSSSGRRARAVMYLPPCFDINKNSAMVESVLFDSLAFGESLMLDSIPNYRPFDLVITDATDYLDTLAVLDSITIGLGTPLAMVVAGVDDPGAYAPNPEGISTAIRLMSVPIPGDSANPADVQIVFANAVTDAPKVSIALQNGATLVDGISFGGAAEPVNLPPDNYTVEVRDSLTQQVITTFAMDLQNSAGKVLTKVLQGFVDPSANQNGAPLELGTVDAGTTIVTAIEDDVQPPVAQQFELLQNYPNPFNPTTRIDFRLPKQAHVKLDVFNVLGQQVATLVDGQLTAGTHSATFDASQHASGLYFYRLKADNEISKVRKMMLLK